MKWLRPQYVFLHRKQKFSIGVQEKSARILMHKVCEAMKSSKDFPMKEIVNVYEYIIGGYQEVSLEEVIISSNNKTVCAKELIG